MATEQARDVAEILTDSNVLVRAASEAAQEAIHRHKQMGLPLAAWKDGRVAWVAAEELEPGHGDEQ